MSTDVPAKIQNPKEHNNRDFSSGKLWKHTLLVAVVVVAGVGGGERKLMAALLSDGIEAYIAQAMTPQALRANKDFDAIEWVETKDERYVFGFDPVCGCLGIDPDYLRIGLQRYIRKAQEMRANGEGSKTVWKKIRRPRKR